MMATSKFPKLLLTALKNTNEKMLEWKLFSKVDDNSI